MKTLFVVGIGPGDPELITVKGMKIISSSDVVFYPVKSLENPRSMAFEIARDCVKGEAVPLLFPMTKDVEILEKAWSKAAEIILNTKFEKASFITIGDPSIYSTFFYIYNRLEGKINIEFIPGVSSITACSLSVGKPLVIGDEKFAVLSFSCNFPETVFKEFDTLVFMKPPSDREELEVLVSKLKKAGFKRIVFVSQCTSSEERIWERLPEGGTYMTTIIAYRK